MDHATVTLQLIDSKFMKVQVKLHVLIINTVILKYL